MLHMSFQLILVHSGYRVSTRTCLFDHGCDRVYTHIHIYIYINKVTRSKAALKSPITSPLLDLERIFPSRPKITWLLMRSC